MFVVLAIPAADVKARGRDYEECSLFIVGNVQIPSHSKEPLDRLLDCSTGTYSSGRTGNGPWNRDSIKALKTVNHLPDNFALSIQLSRERTI